MRKQSSVAPEELNTPSANDEVRVRRRTQAQRLREADADAGLTVEYTSFRDRPAASSPEESASSSHRRRVPSDASEGTASVQRPVRQHRTLTELPASGQASGRSDEGAYNDEDDTD